MAVVTPHVMLEVDENWRKEKRRRDLRLPAKGGALSVHVTYLSSPCCVAIGRLCSSF